MVTNYLNNNSSVMRTRGCAKVEQLICLSCVLPFMWKPLMLTFLNLPSPLKMRASKTSPGPQWNFTRKKTFGFQACIQELTYIT